MDLNSSDHLESILASLDSQIDKLGLTHSDISRGSKLHRSTVKRILERKVTPSALALIQLCHALGMTLILK